MVSARSQAVAGHRAFRKPGGLVSQRVQMYEAPLSVARKGYTHRPQDSFHSPPNFNWSLESRDEETEEPSRIEPSFSDSEFADRTPSPVLTPPSPKSTASERSQLSQTSTVSMSMEKKIKSSLKTAGATPKDYTGCSLIENGVQYYHSGEYEKASKIFLTALKTQRVGVGDDDMCIALTLGNLGAVYLQQNLLVEAERVLTESLEIKRRLAPEMIVADTLNNLGNCSNLRGELESSLIYYEEALDDVREKKGRPADEVNALFNIGRLEIQRQHWTKAMIALNEACRLARDHYGTNHQFVAQTLDLIGFVQISTSKSDAAMISFTSALAIYRRIHGPMHLEVANSLFNVGMVREAKGDLADAWEAYTTSRDLYSRLGTEPEFPGFRTVRRSIANVEKEIAKRHKQHRKRDKVAGEV